MEWLNIHISTLRSPEFIGSNPTERATWLCVLGYSVEQENGGKIVGGATWKDRQWQQACGVTLREIRSADKLLKAEGVDLMVNGYPLAKESHVRQARKVAMAGAMARWGNDAETHAEKMPTGIETAMPFGNAEGKGREQEGKGTGTAPAPASIDDQKRAHLLKLGAEMSRAGTDLFPEWKKAIKGLKSLDVEEIFKAAAPGISWPSEFKTHRSARGNY